MAVVPFHWPDLSEYRFQGKLGFGGKVYRRFIPREEVYVSCYPEDETPERLAMIERANARLSAAGELGKDHQ